MDVKNLNLSDFIRYALSGFNFLLFVLVIPTIYLQPAFTKVILQESSFLTISLLSVAVGYLIDILKLYQLTPRYQATRSHFRRQIAESLGIPQHQVASYFSLTARLSRQHGAYDLERRLSIWVLVSHTAITFTIASLVWLLILLCQASTRSISIRSTIPFAAIIISVICSIRLHRIASRERQKSTEDFLIFMQQNKQTVLKGWKVADLRREPRPQLLKDASMSNGTEHE